MEPKIGLVTLDMRFAARVREEASRLGAKVLHAADSRDLPLDVEVVLASRRERLKIDRKRVLYLEDFSSVSELVERAVELSVVGPRYRVAIVAIDPGKNVGAAYLLDNKVIKTRRYGLIENLIDDVKGFLSSHRGAERRYVVVGAATDFKIVKQIMLELEKALRDEEVTIVMSDESFTSKGLIPRARGMSKDEYSALILSLKTVLSLK